jgi:hypothetical protein
VSEVPAGGAVLRTRAMRAVRHLSGAGARDIVVEADPAGAANLMREIVALRSLDVALEEHEGHWRVVVRRSVDHEAVLAEVIDATARCVESGDMEHATISVGKRSYTIHPAAAPEVPAVAA